MAATTAGRPSPADLARSAGARADDLLAPDLRLLFVGINPSLWTAAVNAHFARPGNRFWPALHRAGITDHLVDASRGLSPQDAAMLADRGIGITNLAPRATARASEVPAEELMAGVARLTTLVARTRPAVVAVLGVSAFRTAFARPRTAVGEQPDGLAAARLWVLPNPSGLNAHETAASLAVAYREAAVAAGVPGLGPSPVGG